MSDNEYPKYDSDSTLTVYGPRLTKDAEVVKTKNGEMTKVTFVHTSAGEQDEEMWMECIINDGQAEKAQQLEKGDTPCAIEGFLVSKRSEEDPTKIFYTLRRARIHFGVPLLSTLKERNGGAKPKASKGAKPTAKAKPVAKPAGKKPTRPIIEDDEDDTDGDE